MPTVQLLLFLAVGAAMFVRGTAGLILGLTAGVLLVLLWAREFRRSRSAFARVKARIQNGSYWPHSEKLLDGDRSQTDRVTGLWNGRRVWVAGALDGNEVKVELEHWPSGLGIERRSATAETATGDAAFDRVVQVNGIDLLWRPLLTAPLRDQVASALQRWHVTIGNRALRCEVLDEYADQLDMILDALTAIDVPKVLDREQRVFDVAREEPIAAVRFGHYKWLVGQQWNAPLVYRTAAADSDAEIAAWAKAELPPDGGVFR